MVVPLSGAVAETCGGKAGALGALLRAGVLVPDGFVVPFDTYRSVVGDVATGPDRAEGLRQAIKSRPLPANLFDELSDALDGLGDTPVAVRSSAANEDAADASAAGQYDSVLGVRGVDEVADAVRICWASLHAPRAVDYTCASGSEGPTDPVMAVLIHGLVGAEISGVMFTPDGPDGATTIEATWGLGPSVVGGIVPDGFRVARDGTVTRSIGEKQTRLDRYGARLVTGEVPTAERGQATLDDATAAELARQGLAISGVLGGAQDIEWAIADGRIWILQARPFTVVPSLPPTSFGETGNRSGALVGTPGSRGTATGAARVVHDSADFNRVRPGDILVCPFTDPAWTPLLRIAAGVVTETGGALAHAAIVARERGIPAVLGVPNATAEIDDGTTITIDGATGAVTTEA